MSEPLAVQTPPCDVKSRLREGVAAAKSGDSVRAKHLIREVVADDPRNETAWMWMSNLSRDPAETLEAIRQVLDINPANVKAKAALPVALTRAGIAAGQKGDPRTARLLLDEALLLDPTNEPAWLWAAGVAETPARAVLCLKRLLALNPDHEAAKEALARSAPPPPKPRPRVSAEPTVRTVLVVDPSATIRKLLTAALGDAGFRVVAAPDARQALDALDASGAPAVVVLEAELPGESGFHLCKRLRLDPLTAGVPVVFLTGKRGLLSRLRGRWAGATEYLAKPCDPATLVAVVESLTRR